VNGQTRFATSTVGYLSASDKRLHFGLGTAEKAKVEIVWPSGIHQTLNDVHADQFLEVKEAEVREPEGGKPEEQNRKHNQ
jgi:trehalose utilization protein